MKGKKAISSKFPTARIKKIMQEDEEIGKVAQGTPIVISRALELFLKDIIIETADIARTTGSKKLQPWHVKRLVAQNRQYDFLDDLVQSVADPTAGVEAGASGTNGGESKPNGRGKGRAATNSGKASSASRSPAVPSPATVSSLPTSSVADSRSLPDPMADSVGVIPAGGARGPIIDTQPIRTSGKGPSNASIILNSPINATLDRAVPGPILVSPGGPIVPARAPEHKFDNYDDDDDDDDDEDDDYDG
ncbi:hypothetical protein QFC19_005829 [Naganishia cerealis]|uniref:Uncharacterized protein n=1 Tax=Naganishia cerealis TaxID=610337 RepID=A0ACC2VLM9_9TREE|nr:hypothetical protein QFC19_005829 [Naganishia cerealis]